MMCSRFPQAPCAAEPDDWATRCIDVSSTETSTSLRGGYQQACSTNSLNYLAGDFRYSPPSSSSASYFLYTSATRRARALRSPEGVIACRSLPAQRDRDLATTRALQDAASGPERRGASRNRTTSSRVDVARLQQIRGLGPHASWTSARAPQRQDMQPIIQREVHQHRRREPSRGGSSCRHCPAASACRSSSCISTTAAVRSPERDRADPSCRTRRKAACSTSCETRSESRRSRSIGRR